MPVEKLKKLIGQMVKGIINIQLKKVVFQAIVIMDMVPGYLKQVKNMPVIGKIKNDMAKVSTILLMVSGIKATG